MLLHLSFPGTWYGECSHPDGGGNKTSQIIIRIASIIIIVVSRINLCSAPLCSYVLKVKKEGKNKDKKEKIALFYRIKKGVLEREGR